MSIYYDIVIRSPKGSNFENDHCVRKYDKCTRSVNMGFLGQENNSNLFSLIIMITTTI
jgi:hypothetical protein